MNSTLTGSDKLRIAIDCRISDFRQGIGTTIQSLAKAFSQSVIDDQEYTFIVLEDMEHHLAPYTWGPCSIASLPSPPPSRLKTALRGIPILRRLRESVRRYSTEIPVSDGYVERGSFDIVHFPTQVAYQTLLPSIYQPHDLQHLHYPQYFAKGEFAQRDARYRTFCARATSVCIHTEGTKEDLMKSYGLPPDKIAVIPWAATTDPDKLEFTTTTRVVDKYRLPQNFFFYPAVTWPHKNHLVLLKALEILRDQNGLYPSLVFTGAITDFQRTLERAARNAGVLGQIRCLGFIPTDDLQGLYSAATAMVYPSYFEGFGLPILEAFQAGTPVLCSNSSVLPEVAQFGAMYFDPNSPAEVATLMLQILTSPELRMKLKQAGKQVLSQYSFENTARQFQALYRHCSPSTNAWSSTLSHPEKPDSRRADNNG